VGTVDRIRTVVAASLGTSLENIHADTKAEDLAEWDAPHQFQIVAEIEEAFGLRFSAEELPALNSIEKILGAVQRRAVPADTPARALNAETIIETLKTIRAECEFAGVDDFFIRGVLDSLDLTLLVSALEERLGVTINGLDIIPENFRNVKAIMALMAKYGVPA